MILQCVAADSLFSPTFWNLVQGVDLLHTTCGTPNYVAPEVWFSLVAKLSWIEHLQVTDIVWVFSVCTFMDDFLEICWSVGFRTLWNNIFSKKSLFTSLLLTFSYACKADWTLECYSIRCLSFYFCHQL